MYLQFNLLIESFVLRDHGRPRQAVALEVLKSFRAQVTYYIQVLVGYFFYYFFFIYGELLLILFLII